MESLISGSILPVLEIGLQPGEMVVSPPGEMAWMTPNIQMNTTTATAGSSGLWGAITRAVSGGGLFMTEFTCSGGPGGVAFTPKVPGQILPVQVRDGAGFMVHRHGFLAGTQGVVLQMGLQRNLGAGIFGGDGFVMQHITGNCQAWVALGGEVVNPTLQAGETLLVHPGHVGMYEDSVSFDITTISGIKNALFGGDGIFLARLTGPGKVWLQTMTVPTLAHALAPFMGRGEASTSSNVETGIAGGVAGSVMRGIFGGGDR